VFSSLEEVSKLLRSRRRGSRSRCCSKGRRAAAKRNSHMRLPRLQILVSSDYSATKESTKKKPLGNSMSLYNASASN
jgi:hypothetical protein